MPLENYKMLDLNPDPEKGPPKPAPENKQPRKLLIALILLLLVLAVVVVKDSDFWFGSDDTAETDSTSSQSAAKTDSAASPAKASPEQTAPAQTASAPSVAAPTPPAPNPPAPAAPAPKAPAASASTAKNEHAPKTHAAPAAQSPSRENVPNSEAPVVANKRVALPPLDVEVVAGDTHKTIHPGSSVTVAEIAGASNRASKVTTSVVSPTTNAAERELLPATAAPGLRQAIDATYPLLGQHSRVQGSVVLEAVIGADGIIENLRVISGSAILSPAAKQAVSQWRFKPYLEHGQAVETKARITVNFTIRVSDNPTKAS
jgi:periplasmic protein TonB